MKTIRMDSLSSYTVVFIMPGEKSNLDIWDENDYNQICLVLNEFHDIPVHKILCFTRKSWTSTH